MISPSCRYQFTVALLSASLIVSHVFGQEPSEPASGKSSKDPEVERICSEKSDNESCKKLAKTEEDLATNIAIIQTAKLSLKQIKDELNAGNIEATVAQTKTEEMKEQIKKATKIINHSKVTIPELQKKIKFNNP